MSSDGFYLLLIILKKHEIWCHHVVNPGGSNGDEGVTSACDKYNMVMFHTEKTIFSLNT